MIHLKTFCNSIGKVPLGMAAFITFSRPASVSSGGVEEISESMRNKR